MVPAKLKPCPFCGGEAKVHVIFRGMVIVCCKNDDCAATCPLSARPKKDAIAAWNRRVQPVGKRGTK